MVSKTEIESLIYLLEDPDPRVQTGVRKRFEELGEHAVPLLDQYRNETIRTSEKDNLSEIIYTITVPTVLEEFADLLQEGVCGYERLEQALFVLSKIGNPTLRTGEYSKKLDQMAGKIGASVAGTPSMEEKMRIVLQYVFSELRFRGDAADYHHPDNAFLDRVIDRRKGIPIILSLVVVFLARRLNLPFHGVNMPVHFILMYKTHDREILIDPFDGGTIVSRDQCCYFLKKNRIEPRAAHFLRATESDILARCIQNLLHSFSKSGRKDKIRDLEEMMRMVSPA